MSRSFLCGQDDYSGNDYEHRRGWVKERLRYLARWFNVEVFAYAVMSNHLHVVLRNNPKRVRGWDDREVACRWLHIFPVQVNDRGNPVVSEAAIAGFLENRRKVQEVRRRLSSISMIHEVLERADCASGQQGGRLQGAFLGGAFLQPELEDDGAIMSCMA